MTGNVPSALIVQTAPSEFVHVPASAAGPEGVIVAQAPMSAIKAPAKIIRRECCSFMAGILPCGNCARQAQIAAKRSVANSFVSEVEQLRGAESANFLDAKTKLVETELEMVRAAWLLQHR